MSNVPNKNRISRNINLLQIEEKEAVLLKQLNSITDLLSIL